jgi:hypothetical protein
VSKFLFSQEAAAKSISELQQVAGDVDRVQSEITSIVTKAYSVWESKRASDLLGIIVKNAAEVDSNLYVKPVFAHLEACLGNYSSTEAVNAEGLSGVMSAYS